MKLVMLSLFILAVAVSLSGCREAGPVFHEENNPVRLSQWNLLAIDDGQLTPHPATLKFKPLNTLFSDYAHKFRTLWVPGGAQIRLIDGKFEYPVGTILSKTFYYPLNSDGAFVRVDDTGLLNAIPLNQHRLLETRLLVRREAQWDAFPYVWNDEQTEAFLRVAGTSFPATIEHDQSSQDFSYFVPNENQCAGCHTKTHPDGGLEPLGAVAHQLNHSINIMENGEINLLAEMNNRGWLESVPEMAVLPSWENEALSIEQRAVAYLDMNCGHCHNPDGPADTSALLLDGFVRSAAEMGVCKPPVAAGGGAGNRIYGIVPGDPDQSILMYRMQSIQPDEMMPELGRSLVHSEGVDLIEAWISQLSGSCR
jgi:uncharacterized repeat protein (TIGR03806 family)